MKAFVFIRQALDVCGCYVDGVYAERVYLDMRELTTPQQGLRLADPLKTGGELRE